MKLTNTIRDAFISAAMQDVPSVDYTEQARSLLLADSLAQLPPKIRAIANDKELSHFVNTGRYFASSLCYVAVYCGHGNEFKPSPAVAEKVAELKLAADSQSQVAAELRTKIKAAAYSVTTRKALADLLPEFAKYLPADEQAALRTVPVVANVVTDFVKAGWPKGGKAKAPKAIAD
jgi:hypothetical protein